MSENAKLLLPAVTVSLQNGNTRIWPTRT